MNNVQKEREWYSGLFAEFEKSLNGQSKASLHKIRQEAMQWFSEHGFPTVRQEEWRFTNVSSIGNVQFKSDSKTAGRVSLDDIRAYLINDNFNRLVFVDGLYNENLSSIKNVPDGVTMQTLAEAMTSEKEIVEKNLAKHAKIDENGFVALNTAFMKQGAYLHIEKNVILEEPVHFLYVATDKANDVAVHPRNLIIADDNSQISFIESYVSLADSLYLTNPVTEVVAGENAVIHHYKIQQESLKAFHTALMQVYQKRSSNYTSHNYVFGGAIARNDLNAVLDGEGIESTLNGLYIARAHQLVDNHSVIVHVKPHCGSRELYKGILDGHARAVFSGKIHVHPDAQKTDAVQSNQNLLLSEDATVDTKPQLEIFADDVKCTHGGTVGQIDQDGVFYLRARGISEATAKKLMIQAFSGEVTDRLKNEKVREHIQVIVESYLEAENLTN